MMRTAKSRVLAFFLCLCICTILLPTTALAAGEVYQGSCGDDVDWVLDTAAGTLTISGTGPMADYRYYADVPWEEHRTEYNKIIVNSGVTHIGRCAFNMWAVGGNQLTTVELPDTVTSIGTGAFTSCEKLVTCNLPDSVTSIGEYAFSGCENLKLTKLPASLVTLESEAFMDCAALGPVLEFPEGVTSIPDKAFAGCTGVKKLTLREGIVDIGGNAFAETSIQKVVIPSTAGKIGDAFEKCTSLRFVDMKGGTSISGFCFSGCKALEKINFPDTLTSVSGQFTFYGCESLTYLYFPASVTELGGYAFAGGCDKLTTVCVVNPECKISGDLGIVGQTIIYGEDGSAVETFARREGYAFKLLGSEPNAPADPVIDDDVAGPGEQDPVNPNLPQFKDVPAGEWYADAVSWAVEKGVTTGVTNTLFKPDNNCTRAQIVTFLWRANGSPEPTSTVNPFVDVPKSQYYYKAVLWAVEQNITTGIDETHFKPDNICKRGQAVTFQWRAAHEPAPTSSENPFVDVPADQFYHDAVLWAVEKNITTGTTATTFKPDSTCTRGHIVTFLYRDLVK